ncbi:hypothetical protein KC19_2G078100 [Ceratodon purpureus]|uniref:Cytochrome P450 n=1 Tax=Ceratodon purpureus TaxID=3225 RepID=A0A8T0IT71_CERPU|nr:hypothetical protein KC19_2G078100 [Ceratodon purpureus]KAG0586276.1 hypothetical protein KC19_2G078100 [Ceratodon purpureus]
MALGISWLWPWLVATLVILATIHIVLQSQKIKEKIIASLPVVVGDTILFLREPSDFLLRTFARRGDYFTITTLTGAKMTVVNSPEAIKFILLNSHKSFSDGYTKEFKRLIGEGKFQDPDRHSVYKKGILGIVTGEGLQRLFPLINSLAQKTVESWENQLAVNTSDEAHKFAFKGGMLAAWRNEEMDSMDMEEIRNNLIILREAVTAIPINFPGFYYHKALKAKRALESRIQKELFKRRKFGHETNDFLNVFMSVKEFEVSDRDIICMMSAMVFASASSTSGLIPWVIKYLHDFPEVLQHVQDEQDSIKQRMAEEKSTSFSWFKMKSNMPYTQQVINEVLRIEPLSPLIPRKVKENVEYKDFVFRKGSTVWAAMSSVQLSPDHFPNPRKFDPSRFEVTPKPGTFMVFGTGPHMCPGAELTKMQTLLLIHHLVTNYRWKRCGPEEIVSTPVRRVTGFPICLAKRHDQ